MADSNEIWLIPTTVIWASDAWAATEGPHLDGADLSLWWALPFAGLLLSIALLLQLAPHIWHRHFGQITQARAALIPFGVARDAHTDQR